MRLTAQDLVFLREVAISIDQETLVSVRTAENTHRDYARCPGCGALRYGQHKPSCYRASILFEPTWYEFLTGRNDRSGKTPGRLRLEQFWAEDR
jgi:transposase